MRDSYSIPLTTTPHAPRRMDTPEKRYTQIGRAPESRNADPNRFATFTSVERGTPPSPAGPEHGCSPPVMKPTSVVLGNGGYWTVPPRRGKRQSARAVAWSLLRQGFGAGSRANLRGTERYCSARNPAAGKPGEPGWRPLTRPGSRTPAMMPAMRARFTPRPCSSWA